MGEVDFGVQHSCDVFVLGELGSVVGGDGEDAVFKRPEHLYYKHGHGFGVLAFRRLGHQHFLGGAFDEGDDCSFAVLSHDGVHLPVAEACLGVHHGRTFVYAHTVLDGDARAHGSPTVLEVVRQIGVECPSTGLILPDDVVHPLDRDTRFPLSIPDTGNSFRRPMSLETLLDFLPIRLRQFPRSPRNRFSHFRELLGVDCDVVPVHVGVPFFLPADG